MALVQKPLMLGLILVIAYLLWAMIAATPAAILTPSQHAVTRHSYQATEILNCLNNTGPYMQFKSKDNKFYLPCQMPDGGFGLGIFTDKGINITAFVPKDGSWNSVREYIIQFATKYTGKLPF